ncbi:MAG TPA: alanine racemase [Xanthobacteraceae bacterium]|jgi:alanine racemase|nr:alanine racemase [Xanthobacteraceae bacterium]
MLTTERAEAGLLLVSGSSDIHGSVVNDTVVQRNCSLHVRGNVLGSLTIEPGAQVVIEGSVDGKIVNKGGRLVVNNKGLAACVTLDGPLPAEAVGTLRINLTNIAANYETLTKRTVAECASVVKANAYGCGVEPVAGALAKTGCKTFFVSNLSEARRVRAVAPNAIIYVINGLPSGGGPSFADINARPVINSTIELAEWDVFTASAQWTGGCALNVDIGDGRFGLSMEETAASAGRINRLDHGIALVMSRLEDGGKPGHQDTQVARFREVRRMYDGIAASLANSSQIFRDNKLHYDLVRSGSALLGINPAPGVANPMMPVIELQARIVQVRNLASGDSIPDSGGWAAKRRLRLAFVSAGYADGYPRPASAADNKLHVVVGGKRCPVVAPASLDLLPVDVTDLADSTAARPGATVTLIGPDFGIDDVAAGAKLSGREALCRLGQRFHRIYYAI